VRGNEGIRLENAVAGLLLKHVNFLQDTAGKAMGLHDIRTIDGNEVDFALSNNDKLVQMIECKWGDNKPHRGLIRFARHFPEAEAVQVVYGLR
jgi:hypothetical protein